MYFKKPTLVIRLKKGWKRRKLEAGNGAQEVTATGQVRGNRVFIKAKVVKMERK